MASSIFNGTAVKILKDILRSKTKGQILFSNVDPSVTSTDASTGDLLISTSGALYIKKDNGSSTNWDVVIDEASLATQLASYIPTSEKAAALGVATLDAGGKVPTSQLPNSVMDYKGNWDASTNTPTLADGVGSAGDVYVTSVAGTQNLGSGNITFAVGDWVVYNGTVWQKSVNSNAVASVNGFTGAVVLDTDDIAEGTALYFTDERAQDAVGSMVTNSSKVSLTYVDGTPSLTADIVSNSLVNADINSSAAIAYSKLNLSNSIVNADVAAAAAIAYSKLNLSASIVNADVSNSAAISYSKLNLSNSIVTADYTADSVDNTKLSNMATQTIKGRTTAGTGDPEDLTASQATAILDVVVGDSGSGGTKGLVPAPAAGDAAAGKFLKADGTFAVPSGTGITQLTGDVTAGPGSGSQAATIANDAVTFAKIQNITTDRLVGRDTAASGDAEEISVTGGLEFTGSLSIQRSALTGDVTASAGSNATTIANSAVSNAKLADMATQTIKGRTTAGTGAPEDLTATQATAILNNFVGDTGSGGTKGLVVAPASGDSGKFLRGDASWATPSSLVDWNITSVKTSAYTAAVGDLVRCNASGGAFTVNMPTAVGNTGKRIGVLKIVTDTSFNQITIDGNGSETLDGALTRKLNTFNEYYEWVSDGANWISACHRTATPWTSYTPTVSATTTAPTSGTGVTVTAYWKRNGNTCNLKYAIYLPTNPPGGTAGSGKYLFPPPTGITLNSTYPFDTSTTQLRQSCVGFGTFNQASVANYSGCSIIAHSNSYLKFYINTQAFWGSDNIPWNPGGDNYISFEASFEATDWEP